LRAGLQIVPLKEFLNLDPYVCLRTSIFTSVSFQGKSNHHSPTSRNHTVVATSGADFAQLERQYFHLLWDNIDVPHLNFTQRKLPWFQGHAQTAMVAGLEFGEREPWWFLKRHVSVPLGDGATLHSAFQCVRRSPHHPGRQFAFVPSLAE
jgi:hypothetical protein